jgi:hypothetical protein
MGCDIKWGKGGGGKQGIIMNVSCKRAADELAHVAVIMRCKYKCEVCSCCSIHT